MTRLRTMKSLHVPEINTRYWAAIALASVFGTNLGDLYAHESGFGLLGGLWLLAAVAALVFVIERRDERTHEIYYWLAILVIRTGATNIADFLRHSSIPAAGLAVGLVLLQAGLACRAHMLAARESGISEGLPKTDALYWAAMLAAGVLGTVLGDDCSHLLGQGAAALTLGTLLCVIVFLKAGSASIGAYWATVALARTAGTAAGDWLAENKILDIGLMNSTLLTGMMFLMVLVFWRSSRKLSPVQA